MYFSSLNLKQRNQNTAVGTHSGPEHVRPTSCKGEVHIHWPECIPIWQLHRCLVAMETSPSQPCFLYSRPVCDRSRCFPMMVCTLAQHTVASRKSLGLLPWGLACSRPERQMRTKAHTGLKLYRMPSNRQGPKRPSYFHRLAGKTFKSTPFSWKKLIMKMPVIKQP